jgi:undecaprenyl diphosphate synthase
LKSKETPLLQAIQAGPIPRHIAIIMDGNGRWAERRELPRIFGHQAGTKSVREMVKACGELGVKVLTLYAFSTENWSRPKEEVEGLMELLSHMLSTEVEDLNKNKVQLRTIGRTQDLPERVRSELDQAIQKLKSNRGLILNLALNYGGRQEIADAASKMAQAGITSVTPEKFSQYLSTAGLPDPDLMIRTSGEMRISNFLLFQLAYAEFFITKTLWPDFRRRHLLEAIAEFQKRDRRFGGR